MNPIARVKPPQVSLRQLCDPRANAVRWRRGPLAQASGAPHLRAYAHQPFMVHGTSVERALQILKDGAIYSHRTLADVADPRLSDFSGTYTDELDQAVGGDRYAFFNIGRVHAVEIRPVYFCFPNRLIEMPDVLVSLRDIVLFDTYVSRESAALAEKRGVTDIETKNRNGAQRWFQNIFEGREFLTDIFPRFLQTHYRLPWDYLIAQAYPGTKLGLVETEFGGGIEGVVENAWDGPQVMVPDRVRLGDFNPALLVATQDPGDMQAILDSGYPREQLFFMSEIDGLYPDVPPLPEPFQSVFRGFCHVNTALRDISLIGRFNRAGETYDQSMMAFHHRIAPGSQPLLPRW